MERLRGAGEPLGADRVLEPLRRSADRGERRSRPCPLRVLLQLRASARRSHIARLSNTERVPCRPGGRLVPSAKGIEYPCCQGCVSLWMFTQSWIAGLACWWVGAEGFDTGIAKRHHGVQSPVTAMDGGWPSASAAVAVAPSAEAEGRRTSNAGTGSTGRGGGARRPQPILLQQRVGQHHHLAHDRRQGHLRRLAARAQLRVLAGEVRVVAGSPTALTAAM